MRDPLYSIEPFILFITIHFASWFHWLAGWVDPTINHRKKPVVVIEGNKCHSCDNCYRGSRGLNFHLRQNRTCAVFYASRVDSTDALPALGGSLSFAHYLTGGDLLGHGSCNTPFGLDGWYNGAIRGQGALTNIPLSGIVRSPPTSRTLEIDP